MLFFLYIPNLSANSKAFWDGYTSITVLKLLLCTFAEILDFRVLNFFSEIFLTNPQGVSSRKTLTCFIRLFILQIVIHNPNALFD